MNRFVRGRDHYDEAIRMYSGLNDCDFCEGKGCGECEFSGES